MKMKENAFTYITYDYCVQKVSQHRKKTSQIARLNQIPFNAYGEQHNGLDRFQVLVVALV